MKLVFRIVSTIVLIGMFVFKLNMLVENFEQLNDFYEIITPSHNFALDEYTFICVYGTYLEIILALVCILPGRSALILNIALLCIIFPIAVYEIFFWFVFGLVAAFGHSSIPGGMTPVISVVVIVIELVNFGFCLASRLQKKAGDKNNGTEYKKS